MAHHLLQGDGVGAEGDGARLQLREFQKGGHQPVHLAQQLIELPAQLGPPLGGEVLFVQQLRHQIHGGEGGAQLVGQIGQGVGQVYLVRLQGLLLFP